MNELHLWLNEVHDWYQSQSREHVVMLQPLIFNAPDPIWGPDPKQSHRLLA